MYFTVVLLKLYLCFVTFYFSFLGKNKEDKLRDCLIHHVGRRVASGVIGSVNLVIRHFDDPTDQLCFSVLSTDTDRPSCWAEPVRFICFLVGFFLFMFAAHFGCHLSHKPPKLVYELGGLSTHFPFYMEIYDHFIVYWQNNEVGVGASNTGYKYLEETTLRMEIFCFGLSGKKSCKDIWW